MKKVCSFVLFVFGNKSLSKAGCTLVCAEFPDNQRATEQK